MNEQSTPSLVTHRFNLNQAIFFVYVVEDPETIDSKFPLSEFIRAQALSVAGFYRGFVAELLFDFRDDPPSVGFLEEAQIFDGFQCEFDFKHEV